MSNRISICPLVALLLLASAVLCQEDWTINCPSACRCSWVSGKKSADCRQQNLTALPDGLSLEIQSLDLSANRIDRLDDGAFVHVQLPNMQKLLMRDCALRYLDAKAFRGLSLVLEIDLSGNELARLHPDTFTRTQRLRVLRLNRNRLSKLEDGTFRDLLHLRTIEFSGNRLVQIGRSTFRNLPNLASLSLDHNQLAYLEVASFEALSNLRSLELRGNPWNCDCRLGAFRDWTIQRHLVENATTKCAMPTELAGRAWEEVRADEMICGPPPTTTMPKPNPRVETVSGGNGEKVLRIDGSGTVIIIPRGNKVRLEWNDNSTVLNFD